MTRETGDALILGVVGLMVGAAFGMLAAGAYATWATGGDLRQIHLGTILDFSPLETGRWREPFTTAAAIGAGVALAAGVLAAAAGWRRPLMSHGAARWATSEELRRAGMTARIGAIRGPVFGKLGPPRSRAPYLSTDRTPHSLIVAPTGSGKGVGVVIPTLLTYQGSILCLDVKGENFAKTARRRQAMGDRVFKFSPYDDEGRTHRFNPLDEIAAARPRRRFTEARRLASSLIVARSRSAEGFVEGAREIFAAAAVLAIERDQATIATVYDLLSRPGEAQAVFAALGREAQSPEAQSVFNRMAAADGRVLSSYLSVLSEGGLSLWADPAVRDATAASDFALSELRRDPATIYLVVSPNDLVPLAPLVRLLFQQAVASLQRAEPGPDEPFPVLFLLDEFGSLGRMDALGAAITTLRSFGGRVMIVVQSMAHLKEHYGAEGATNFLANCGVQLFMAPADAETPEYVSRAIGDFTRRSRSTSWRNGQMGGATVQEREEGARLIRPEDLRRLGEGAALALIQNCDPAKVRKVRYFEDRALRRLFEGQRGLWPEPEPEARQAEEMTAAAPVTSAADMPELTVDPPSPPLAAPLSPPAPRTAAPREPAEAGLDRISEKQAALLARLELARRARAEAEAAE